MPAVTAGEYIGLPSILDFLDLCHVIPCPSKTSPGSHISRISRKVKMTTIIIAIVIIGVNLV